MTFTDLYLRADTPAEMDAALSAAGIFADTPGVDFDRLPIPFHRFVHYESDGEAVWAIFDECHVNIRMAEPLTPEQEAVLEPFHISTPSQPFRRWA